LPKVYYIFYLFTTFSHEKSAAVFVVDVIERKVKEKYPIFTPNETSSHVGA